MGTGARLQRAALGQTRGESIGIQEHTVAMIPILEKQAASELDIRQKVFEQEIKQAEAMNLLSQKFEKRDQQPIFVSAPAAAEPVPLTNYLPIVIVGILLILYIRKKG